MMIIIIVYLLPAFFYIIHMYSECDAFFMWEMDIREATLSALAVGYPIDYTWIYPCMIVQ